MPAILFAVGILNLNQLSCPLFLIQETSDPENRFIKFTKKCKCQPGDYGNLSGKGAKLTNSVYCLHQSNVFKVKNQLLSVC